MTDKALSDIEKAAVTIISLGETDAAEVLKFLDPKEVQKISEAVANLKNIPKSVVEDVIDEFIDSAEDATGIGINNDEYVKEMLIQTLGEEKAKTLIDRILITHNTTGLDMLRWMEPRQVAEIIRFEHPQIQTVILGYLDSDQAAEVLTFFDEVVRLDLVMRVAALDRVQPEALQDLNDMLETQFSGSRSSQEAHLGGVQQAANILNNIGTTIENEIMAGIKEVNEVLADEISELMFVFENFMDMDDRTLQRILRDVQPDTMMLALKGANEELQERLLGNISQRAAEIMRDDMEAKGPVRVVDVEAAQKEMLAIAKKLADEGEIVMGSGEGMI